MSNRYWPLVDLRIRSADLVLRPLTEPDLELLADVMPLDVELDPSATRFPIAEVRTQRGVTTYQSYWKGLGAWSPDRWRLKFAVEFESKLVGVQELEADDFLQLRTVDSSSFLLADARGRGWGKQMRIAVLALAFDHLGAEVAITSAYEDNYASLGVSRSIGYRDNGVSRIRRGDGVSTLVHLRLTHDQWSERGLADQIVVSDLVSCLPLFGL